MVRTAFNHLYQVSYRIFLLVTMLTLTLGSQVTPVTIVQAQSAPAPLAATSTLSLSVISARTEPRAFHGTGVTKGTPITTFKYMINVDNTGTTEQRSPNPGTGCSPQDAGYPNSCHWTSVAGVLNGSFSPIYASGDQSDFANGSIPALANMPAGRYLISVTADGYKLDGTHFTVPLSGPVTVELQPTPLPDATVRTWVFEDTAPTNSAPDAPAEHGLGGFQAHISDYLAEVTNDVYGHPLCTTYAGEDPATFAIPNSALDPATQLPVVAAMGGKCFSLSLGTPAQASADPYHYTTDPLQVGMLAIPHLGTDRFALSVVPPLGTDWIQTTTLEGNHDWDSWAMEGSTGYDTEFVVAGEPFPATFFGFVHGNPGAYSFVGTGTGEIKGVAMGVKAYIPPVGGIVGETGLMGARTDHPIDKPWITLSDLNNGDQTVYAGQGNADGSFDITGVPNGDYVLGVWDEPQDYIFNEQNVSIQNGELTNLGNISMLGWWTTISGHVFNDLNGNGKMDPGEPGINNFPITVKRRENSVSDRGAVRVQTDQNGFYYMENAYPITQWLVEEAYVDGYHTTGVTYQADNQPTETTVLGTGVDVNFHPVIGLGGRLDWGVQPYDAAGKTCNPVGSYTNCTNLRNGGIVGTVTYDTTRNEVDPQYAVTEDWQPGVPGLTVDLYAPAACPNDGATPCDATGQYAVNPTTGAIVQGQLLNTYVTETWQRPQGCVARDVNNNPLQHGIDENVLPLDPNADCLEAPMMGMQFGPMSDGTNFGASVDGNYGFNEGCFNGQLDATDPSNPLCVGGSFAPLPARDYLVHVEIPNDATGKPLFKWTKEEDVNIFHGDQFIPQVPPPSCVGALHTVDLAGSGTDNYPSITLPDPSGLGTGTITVPASTPIDNPEFAAAVGSPYEGTPRPLCDTKLVHVSNGKSIAPNFNVFTDVPEPTRWWGIMVDDLNFSGNPKSTAYGEKLPLAFAPVGVYDFANRLVDTVETDYNGFFDELLPSTNRISCPTPSGVCAGTYRLVGNDPGTPGHWNPNYNAQYRTIAAEFETFPGLLLPVDLAPTPVSVAVQIPGIQTTTAVSCTLDSATPQFFAVNKPYMYTNASGAARRFTITGLAFGATQGTGQVTFDNTTLLPVTAWSDRSITFRVPDEISPGPHQLKVTAANGRSAVNGLTFHVVQTGNGGYNPTVYEVGPGHTYATIQSAVDAAAGQAKALVVVYPGAVDNTNPRYNGRGAYYENIIIHSPVKLQGVGPGGVYPDGTPVQGTIIDGIGFGGDTALATAWLTKIGTLTWDGNQNISDGQVIYILAHDGQFTSAFNAAIDGMEIRGGDQMGLPGNLNAIFGGFPGPAQAANVETQGGAIFANAYARYLQITNNVVDSNGGSYGAIRFGTPNIATQHNENVRIANNRIFANGGTNLAGAIGLFNGADNYEIANNDLCGNFSAEYGGAISHFGLSSNGSIHDNRIYFNSSYDEGAGVMVAGELPVDPTAAYGSPNGAKGSGPVNIFNNLIQANLSDDDGGGLRFLMSGNFPMNVFNNMIVNNVSTHEGGGVAIDDAPNVRFYNNTVMKNITTATAITSNGQPAPAGLSTALNSNQLQATLPAGSPLFSNPFLFNNIFWDNRAGTKGTNMVTGIGAAGDASPINYWDLGTSDGSGLLSPTNSVLQSGNGINASPTNTVGADPKVVSPFDVGLTFTSWRTNVNFIGAIMVTADLPPNLMGDYHLLNNTSPAYNLGAASKIVPTYQQPPSSLTAPAFDIDHDARPAFGGFDSGADEIRGTQADLAISKTDGQANAYRSTPTTYTIVVSNLGPDAATGATVTDNLPATLTGATWTCTATTGSSCGAASGTGNLNTTVSLLNGGNATFTLTATVSASATVGSSLANTATVSVPAAIADPNSANNSATDTDTVQNPSANLAVTKTDGVTSVVPGATVNYTIVVSNAGPSTAVNATVNDTMPAALTGVTWTCTASAGSSCTASGSGNLSNSLVTLLNGGTATFTVSGTVNPALHGGTLSNTVTVAAPAGTTDPTLGNNIANDTDPIILPLPVASILDNFNRANATNLGANWSPGTGTQSIRVNSNQAFANAAGQAIWNASSFGINQTAAFTFANSTSNGNALILKATGGTATTPTSFIRVQYQTGPNRITVSTTTNGTTFTTRAIFLVNFNNGDRLSATAYSDGTVNVYRTTAANVTTFLGSVTIPTSGGGSWTPGSGGGRIGILLPNNARVDDFRGGTLP